MRENPKIAALIPDSVRLRELVTLFPTQRYPEDPGAPSAAEEVARWMADVYASSYPPRQLAYFISQNVRDVVLSGFPTAVSRERVVWLMKYYEALTAVDDAANSRWSLDVPQALAMLGELEDAIHDRPVRFGTEIARQQALAIRGMRKVMPQGLTARFTKTFQTYLDRLRSELLRPGVHALGAASLDDFALFRYENYSGPCILTQLEYALGVDLTEQLTGSPELEEIGRKAIYHSQIVNDLTSFGRESNHGEHCNSAYFLLSRHGIGLQDAFDQLCDRCEAYDRDFWRLRKSLLSGPLAFDPAVVAYVHGLEYMISGFDAWHFMTNRFRHPGHRWDGETHAVFDTRECPANYQHAVD